MRIAFLSKYGDAADIALRMALDSNKVSLFIEDPKYKENFQGIVPKADTWQQAIKGADLVVFDDTKLSHIHRQIHKQVPCFGGSEFAARLENDRAFGHALMERVGIPRIESKSFKSLREVIPHLKEHKVAHVIKPSGIKVESHHVIVGEDEDNSDTISQVERLIEMGLPVESVEVEERIHGVETGLSIWFNGNEVVGPVNINWEHKRSNEKETGYLTGEMGTLMRYVEDPDLPLYKDTLAKVIPALRAASFRGQIDLNLIVDEDGVAHPLEWTPRLGKPAIFIEDELHVTSWAELFHGIATGKPTNLQVRYDWAVGVVLAGFGFPFQDKAEKISKGLVVKGLDENSLDHVHPMQLKLDKKGRFVVGAGEGYLLVSTGRGSSIHAAKDSAYAPLHGIKVPGSFFRHDISDKIDRYRLDDLRILPLEESVA